MGATMAARVHRFLQEAVPVVSGDDDPDEAGASEERGSPTALDSLGQLPLMQLLQLRAFLALHASSVYLPSGLDVVPEVQASLGGFAMHAEGCSTRELQLRHVLESLPVAGASVSMLAFPCVRQAG